MATYQDFEEFLELLNENKVEYLIVGGYALSIYSRAKYTKDIDIWVNPTKENAKKVVQSLKQFGINGNFFTIEDFIKKDNIIQLGYEPIRIDIIISLEGLKFSDAYKHRFFQDYGRIKNVPYISLDDLIKNKKSTDREKDKEDLRWIKQYGVRKRKK